MVNTSRIVLINPPTHHLMSDTGVVSRGLLSIHSFLKRNNIESLFVDLAGSNEELWPAIPDSDIYGITSTSCQISYVGRLARFLKERNNKCIIIMGGPHAIALPEDCLRNRHADFACVSEGEIALMELLKSDFKINRNFAYLKNNKVTINNILPLHKNIELFYPLLYQDIGIHRYLNPGVFKYINKTTQDKQLTIIFSRGCYGTCKFCMSGSRTAPIRYRNINNMIKEINYHKDRWGINRIYFDDDELLTDKKHLFDLCNGMKKTGLDWMCLGRTDMASKDRFKIMKDSGCSGIVFGVESFANRVLDGLAKRTTVKQNYNALILAHSFGFKVRAQMMVGCIPYETESTIDETAEYIKKVNKKTKNAIKFSFHIFQPLPGTASYQEAMQDPIHWDQKILTDFNSFQTVGDFKNDKTARPLIAHKNRDKVYDWYDYLNDVAGKSELLVLSK